MRGFVARGGMWVAVQLVIFGVFVWTLRIEGDVPAVVRALGWSLTAAGALLAGGGLVTLGPNLTPYPEPVEQGRLVERGVYRLVRHPIYGGLCVGAVGLALARGSLPALAIGLGLLIFFGFKSRGEEQRLAAVYPEYVAYQTRVPARLIPWLL